MPYFQSLDNSSKTRNCPNGISGFQTRATEDSNISYKLYRRCFNYYFNHPVEKDIEVISYGLYSKGLFRDTLDRDFSKLIQFEEAEAEESKREKRYKAKQTNKRRDRQHRGKYSLELF